MQNGKFFIFYVVIVSISLFISGCRNDNKICDDKCDNGYCLEGDCVCRTGYEGVWCKDRVPCTYTQYAGNSSCANTGYYPVSSTACCPQSSPYHCPGTGKCYTSCEAAVEAGCSGSSIVKANLSATGGGGTGGGGTGGGGTGGGGTGGGTNEGQLMIYNSNSSPCPAGAGSTISVYIDGVYAGGLSSYYSTEPSCGASGAITKTLSPGSYSVSASCGSNSWSPSSITVVNGGCSVFQLY